MARVCPEFMSTNQPAIGLTEVLAAFQGSFKLNVKIMRDYYGLVALEVMPDRSSQLSLTINGAPATIHLPSDGLIGANTFLDKGWDAAKPRLFAKVAESCPGGIVLVDIGANVGLFSRQCLSLIPNLAATFCYEPHPGNFELLTRNVGGAPNVNLFRKGLSNTSGNLMFYEDPNNVGNNSLNLAAMTGNYRQSPVEIAEASTQEVLWLSYNKPIFYKSDTQGHDELIATALSDRFWSRVKIAVFELWRLAGKSFDRDRFTAILDSFPYKVFQSKPAINVGSSAVIEYLNSTDRTFDDLVIWR